MLGFVLRPVEVDLGVVFGQPSGGVGHGAEPNPPAGLLAVVVDTVLQCRQRERSERVGRRPREHGGLCQIRVCELFEPGEYGGLEFAHATGVGEQLAKDRDGHDLARGHRKGAGQ